jgi:hypothetical protein
VTLGSPKTYVAHPGTSSVRQDIYVQCLGLHPLGRKLYVGVFPIGSTGIDTPLVVYDLGADGMPTAKPPRAYTVHDPVTQQFGCWAMAFHPNGHWLYAIGRRSWSVAVFKLDPEGEPVQQGSFITDEIVHYGGVSLGFVAGDEQSRVDKLVIGSLTLGNANTPDMPTMRTLDLNKEGAPIGSQTQDYPLPNATSVFDPGYAALTVGPKGVYYKTRDAGLGYYIFGATGASPGQGQTAVGNVQAVGSELLGGSLLVALDHSFNKRADGFSLQSIPLGPEGKPAQGVFSSRFLFRKQCKLLAATPSLVMGGSTMSVLAPDLAATIRYLATASPEASLPTEIGEPWYDYGRNASAAAESFGLIKAAERKVFRVAFVQAWMEAAVALARRPSIAGVPGLNPTQTSHLILLSWHCPEYLRLIPLAPRLGAIVLMAQDADWFGELRRAGSLLVTTKDGAAAHLHDALNAGRPIVAMIDTLPVDTMATIMALLFGRAVPTDVAMLRAGRDAGYRFVFVTPRNGHLQTAETIDPRGMADADLATRVNALLEREVRSIPARWLLWPALPSRAVRIGR